MDTQYCTLCTSPTIAKCLCGVSYCSAHCYNKDWPIHRENCTPGVREWSPFLSDQFINVNSSGITFQFINQSNYQSAVTLCVSRKQERYVGTLAEGLVKSIFRQWRPLLVVMDSRLIGFIAYSIADRVFYLHRLLIDSEFQGR